MPPPRLTKSPRPRKWQSTHILTGCLGMAALWVGVLVYGHSKYFHEQEAVKPSVDMPFLHENIHKLPKLEAPTGGDLPMAFEELLERARAKQAFCHETETFSHEAQWTEMVGNETIATLPHYGIVHALEGWEPHGNWECELPPETECDETQLTVIFMAYNPDRLDKTFRQMQKMMVDPEWKTLVAEIVLVWNGPRHVDESDDGKKLLEFAKDHPIRVEYPLKMGLENDLMNRYHPDVVRVTKTKAILYYDDDGPFYSFAAVRAGFELWKRHADQQMGAMSRQIQYSPRQTTERQSELGGDLTDSWFVSHCPSDHVDYVFAYFANYDANMVLPSGSMLHANYLCFLWHPVLEEIRKFVRLHPVHPDDVTVSTIVSQLAGKAPRVYSRRLNAQKGEDEKKQRRLSEWDVVWDDDDDVGEDASTGIIPLSEMSHRKLLFGIDWDADHNMNDAKQYWADLRSQAVNALVRYFGSLNSGSLGWCENTEYFDLKAKGKCTPLMAKIGMLPWMQPDGSPKNTCP